MSLSSIPRPNSSPKKRMTPEIFKTILLPLIGSDFEDNIRWLSPRKTFLIDRTDKIEPDFLKKFGYETTKARGSFITYIHRNFNVHKLTRHKLVIDLTKPPVKNSSPDPKRESQTPEEKFRWQLNDQIKDEDTENIHWVVFGDSFTIMRLSKLSDEFLADFGFRSETRREDFRKMLKRSFRTTRDPNGQYICYIKTERDNDEMTVKHEQPATPAKSEGKS